MKEFQLIDGKTFDREWLYNLYQDAMKPCIEATWGWNEEFQSNGFDNNLKPIDWKIINNGIERIGGFVLNEDSDHLWLIMIIIKPEYRRKGIGQRVLGGFKTEVQHLPPIKVSRCKAARPEGIDSSSQRIA